MAFPYLEVLTILLSGTNITTFFYLRSSQRREKALATQEEANSVTKSQEIYNTLTAIMDRELEKLGNRLKQQDILLDSQQKEIESLRQKVKTYADKCAVCAVTK